MLVRREGGGVYDHIAPNGSAATPDFTNPATYDYVGSAFRDMIGRVGMDGFMADFGEWAPLDGVYASGADPRVEHNLFPLRWHAAWRRTLDELRPDGDYVVFARSGFTGVHRFAQVYWVGDQEADFSPFDGLPTVIPAMLTLGISGIPFVTHDVAGFSGGPSTKELTMRWTELGAFSPILRTHDGNKRDENWAWDEDEETIAHFARMAKVHERLGPELRSLAEEAARTGAPIVRHLVLVYPADRESARTHDEFLLGDRLLVAPVVTAGARSRRVYFPPGSAWYNVWTGVRFEGGASAEVDAPIGSPAVFARDADRADLRAP
jgi:alpha-glucosidase